MGAAQSTADAAAEHGGEWLTLDDIATDLRIPVETVYRWRKKRTGPRGHRIGRHIRVRRDDYEAWLAEQADDYATSAR